MGIVRGQNTRTSKAVANSGRLYWCCSQGGQTLKRRKKNVNGSHLGGFIFVNFETGCQNWSMLIASTNVCLSVCLSVCPSVYPPPTDKLSVSLKYTTGNDFLLTESSCASLCRYPATEPLAPASVHYILSALNTPRITQVFNSTPTL